MLVSENWLKETAIEIIDVFNDLLCQYNIKIDNSDINNNVFENKSNINKKDYDDIKQETERILKDFADYVEYITEEAA